jgi:hypothetical protein
MFVAVPSHGDADATVYMGGAGFGVFLELREKFIFLMEHPGDVSPPWLWFYMG